jgi:beta-phosphoglucomutase-like phosphatase (HAD superfamily)
MLVTTVIFDMDGVLIDARDWHFRALNKALSYFNAEISVEEHLSKFDGLPTKVKLKVLASQGRIPIYLSHIIEEIKQERTIREAAMLCFPILEHLLLFGKLQSEGIKVGVATNSIRLTSETFLGFAGLLDKVDVLVCNEDVTEAKPSPEIYIRAMALLGSNPDNTIVVEDSPFGIQAAESANCTVLKVSSIHDVKISLFREYFHESKK